MQDFLRRFGLPPGAFSSRRAAPELARRCAASSGFIVSPDGLILTNAHVVRGARPSPSKLTDRREFKAKVLGRDGQDRRGGAQRSTRPACRRWRWAPATCASAMGDGDRLARSASRTHRHRRRGQRQGPLAAGRQRRALHPDRRRRQPGNSGGPLINAAEVVGINSQIYSRSGGWGVSFAILIELASHRRTRSWRTAGGARAPGRDRAEPGVLADSFKLPRPGGALVAQVEKGSAAVKAGLKPGDVILRADGQAIVDSDGCPASRWRAGRQAAAEVWRNGRADSSRPTLQGPGQGRGGGPGRWQPAQRQQAGLACATATR